MAATRVRSSGFGYSAAMKGRNDKTWDADGLDHFLKGPKAYRSRHGDGLRRHQQGRHPCADVIAYLNTLSDRRSRYRSPERFRQRPSDASR